MKSKKVKLGILVLVAVVLFTATAFAASSGNDGYEALKQIMKDAEEVAPYSNVTLDGTFRISDNGTTIAEIAGKGKAAFGHEQASGNVQIILMGKGQELSFYKNGETSYLVDETNTKYYQLVNLDQETGRRHEAYRREEYAGSHKMGTAGEALLDYFVGDLKSQFEVSENTDGTRSITLDLRENEIPASFNLLAGAAAEQNHAGYHPENDSGMEPAQKELLMQKLPFLKEFSGLEEAMPKLKQNVKFSGIVLNFTVNENNRIQSFAAKISITGNDADGSYHEITLQGTGAVSDINNTAINTFNPDGKSIEMINCEEFKCDRE